MFRVNPVNLKSVSVYCDDVHCVYNGELNEDDLKNAMSFENSIMRGASLSQVNASNEFEFEFEDMIVRGLKNEYDCWYDDVDYQCVCYECTKEMKSYIKSGLLFEYDNHVYPLNCGYHMKCENVKKAISTCLVSHGYLLKSEDLSIYYCNEKICEGESLQSVGVGKNDVLYVLSSGVVNRVNNMRLNELMFGDVNDFVVKALNNDLNEVNHLILRMSDDVDVRNVLNDLIGCCLPNVVVLSLLSEDDEIVKSFLNHPCFPCLSRVFVYSEYVDEIENTLELNDYDVKTNQVRGFERIDTEKSVDAISVSNDNASDSDDAMMELPVLSSKNSISVDKDSRNYDEKEYARNNGSIPNQTEVPSISIKNEVVINGIHYSVSPARDYAINDDIVHLRKTLIYSPKYGERGDVNTLTNNTICKINAVNRVFNVNMEYNTPYDKMCKIIIRVFSCCCTDY